MKFCKKAGLSNLPIYKTSSKNYQGSAILIALIFTAALSIAAFTFVYWMIGERDVVRSYKHKAQAELLVDGAVELAAARLHNGVTGGPFASVYLLGGEGAPYLAFARMVEDDRGRPDIEYRALFSSRVSDPDIARVHERIVVGPLSVLHRMTNGENVRTVFSNSSDVVVNLNRVGKEQPFGAIGLCDQNNKAVPIWVNWIYQTNHEGRIVGRYAYWIDDESSKIDLRFAGNEDGPDGSHRRGNGSRRDEISLHSLARIGFTEGQIRNLFNYKKCYLQQLDLDALLYPLPNEEGLADGEAWSIEQLQKLRPFFTRYSRSDDRAFDGKRKLNLNKVVSTTNSETEIREQIRAIAGAIEDALPAFGTRYFQRKGEVNLVPSEAEQQSYRLKLAANIRDYIDTDGVATVLIPDAMSPGGVRAYCGIEPNFFPYEAIIDEVPIIGKERGPFLNEYARVVRVVQTRELEPSANSKSIREELTIRFVHYVELYNVSDTAITYHDLGPNPRIILANRVAWENKSVGGTRLRPMDLELRIPSDFSIPANGYAVLYTDDQSHHDSSKALTIHPDASAYIVSKGQGPGTWSTIDRGKGQSRSEDRSSYEDYVVVTEAISENRYNIQCAPMGNSYAQCRERILFVNDEGIIDMSMRIYTVSDLYVGRNERNPVIQNTFISDGATSISNTFPSASESAPRLTRGDPRSNTEISSIEDNTSACWKAGGVGNYGDKEEWVQLSLGARNFGFDPNDKPIWRKGWAEYSASGSNHFVRNGPMQSVGELGFIYDPARYSNQGFRSYGRTLRVGQSDASTTNRISNASKLDEQRWLGGLGSDDVADLHYARNAFLLCDVFCLDGTHAQGGRINLNGLERSPDDFLLEVLFHNFMFNGRGIDGSSGALVSRAIDLPSLSSQIRAEFANQHGFIHVGDLSKLPAFSTSDPKKSITGRDDMSQLADADKEEVFRRVVGLLCTQSLAFKVHVVAQSGSPVGDRFHPIATSSKSVIVSFEPKYPPDVTAHDRPTPVGWNVKCLTVSAD